MRLGDNATAGQGTYEVYLNPISVFKNLALVPLASSEYNSDADVSGITNAGAVDVGVLATSIQIPYDDTHRQNFEKALIYWHKQSTLLYITCKNGSTDWLTVPDYATQAMAAFRGRVKTLSGYEVTPEVIRINQMLIKRYTA